MILKDVGGDAVLPIWVGIYEANAIALEIKKVTTPRPNTPALTYIDSIPEEEKTLRLALLNARQKEISLAANQRHLGEALEVMVEGRNPARSQWIGRTSQHKVLNFTTGGGEEPRVGQYVPVRVTATFPNSLFESKANKFSPARMLLLEPNSGPNSGRIPPLES